MLVVGVCGSCGEDVSARSVLHVFAVYPNHQCMAFECVCGAEGWLVMPNAKYIDLLRAWKGFREDQMVLELRDEMENLEDRVEGWK